MSTNLEEQLVAGMRQEVQGVTLTNDVLGRARKRHGRRAALVRLGYGLGVIGVAGALVAGVTLNGAPADKPPAAADNPATSPALRLAGAATATDSTSYRITYGSKGSATRDGKPAGSAVQPNWEGAFDPKTNTGYARQSLEHGVLTEILVNGTRYIGTEPRPDGVKPTGEHEAFSVYGQYPGTHDRLSFGLGAAGVVAATTPDPTGLLRALKEANATTTEKPDGTLHFRYTVKDTATSVYDGDVTLDGNGRISKVVITGTWESSVKGFLDKGEFVMTLQLSDFGLPVTAERPAKVQPVK